MSNETISLERAIEMVLEDGPTFETIAGLCKMAVYAEREAIARSLDKQADLAGDPIDREWAQEMASKVEQDFKGAFGADTCASWAAWIKEQK